MDVKIVMVILISLIATIISVIAGLMSDVRFGIVMLRGVLTFAISGFGLFSLLMWTEKYAMPGYLEKHKGDKDNELIKAYNLMYGIQPESQEENKTEEDNLKDANEQRAEAKNEPEEEKPLVDVNISDEPAIGIEPLTPEELASLSGNSDEPNEEDANASSELGENEEEFKQDEFAPLEVESMTRLSAERPEEKVGA